MCDVVVISRTDRGYYDVGLLRVSTQVELDRFLAGGSLKDLPDGSYVYHVVPAPDAMPPATSGPDGITITSLEKAIELVEIAFRNPASVAGQHGFLSSTTIYFCSSDDQPARHIEL